MRQTSADLRTQAERQHKSMALHVLSLKATLRNMSASIGTVAADDEPAAARPRLHRTVSELSGKLEDVARILRHTGRLAGGGEHRRARAADPAAARPEGEDGSREVDPV